MNGNDLTGSRACKMGGFCLYHLPVGEIERQDFCWKCGKAKRNSTMKKSKFDQCFFACPGAWTGAQPGAYPGIITIDPAFTVQALKHIQRFYRIKKTHLADEHTHISLKGALFIIIENKNGGQS